ncbi:MAG: FAD-dependent oxidoreductase [Leptospirales bacterium]|nr:FAD-dependent oxidoreductase [Leptospirales bacterium]
MDVVVIGAGLIGTWIAYECANRGLVVALCDQSDPPGDGISGRNSGVLHAGLYYTPGSLKAKHCIRGRKLAIDFFENYNVPYMVCGKLITAGEPSHADDEETILKIKANAEASGAEGIEILQNPGRMFPGVRGKLALHSAGTGVVDAAAYLKRLYRAAEESGVTILAGRTFVEGHAGEVTLENPAGERETIQCGAIINAAGLESDTVARNFGVDRFEIRPNRGEYFRLRKNLDQQILVYPLPHTDSTALGVHYTFHLNGDSYAGPNSIWAETKADYRVTASREEFHRSLSRILDGYTLDDLQPGYSGLRPRLFENGNAIKDFVILEQPARVVHMLGIESPGLTSAPSLAREVCDLLLGEKGI